MTAENPISLALGLLPQAFGRARPDSIEDPVVEPRWPGLRVIAAATGDGAALFVDGEPLDGHDRVAEALRLIIDRTADGVILDGYLTKHVASESGTQPIRSDTIPTPGQLAMKSFVGIRRNRSAERARQLDAEAAAQVFDENDVVNLIATDLLWLDDQWLLDVPLLERKRLLDSVVAGGDRVRTGPYVRPPFQTWIGSWRAQGFTGILLKEVNSRYAPGTEARDWVMTDLPRR